MNTAALIAKFAAPIGPVTVTRFTPGARANGVYTPGVPDIIPDVFISIQPLSGRELLSLPEGDRTRNWMKGYSAIQLFTADQSEAKKADLVEFQGKQFEVRESQPWVWADSHWKIRIAEVNPT